VSGTGEQRDAPPGAALASEPGVVSADVDGLAAFYGEALGFEVVARFELPQGVVVRLRNGSALLKLYQPAEPPTGGGRADPWHGEPGFAYAALHVDDVDGTHRRAVTAGATSIAPPTSHRPGARYAMVADPEGNVWELLQEQRDA
jgi:uncharacterized glyoxalase superfamily protein PhnB